MRFFYVRLHTHAEYASMKLITCSEYFIRIHRSKKRSTGKQPLHIRTILFKFYFAFLCNEFLNYCWIKIYLGAFKKTCIRHVTRYFLAICHFGQILEHEKQFQFNVYQTLLQHGLQNKRNFSTSNYSCLQKLVSLCYLNVYPCLYIIQSLRCIVIRYNPESLKFPVRCMPYLLDPIYQTVTRSIRN